LRDATDVQPNFKRDVLVVVAPVDAFNFGFRFEWFQVLDVRQFLSEVAVFDPTGEQGR